MKKGFTLIEMLVVIAIVGILAVVTISVLSHPAKAEACGFWTPCATSATANKQAEQESSNAQLTRLTAAVPVPHLENSLERQNISNRLTLFSNPSKISYIYLTSFGKVMAFYTVKGKITSGSKRLTSADQIIDDGDYSDADTKKVVAAPELDGTYGNSADYIYFWTTDGTYVQWNGEYMLADQPLQLTTPPELIRSVNGK